MRATITPATETTRNSPRAMAIFTPRDRRGLAPTAFFSAFQAGCPFAERADAVRSPRQERFGVGGLLLGMALSQEGWEKGNGSTSFVLSLLRKHKGGGTRSLVRSKNSNKGYQDATCVFSCSVGE